MNFTPRSAKTALRNLIIVLGITLVAGIYAYGWTVTDIDLEKPQEENRQASVQNALRELLSPRIFEQDREVFATSVPFLVGCDEGEAPESPESTSEAGSIRISPNCGRAGDAVTIEASGFENGVQAAIRWVPVEGQRRPREVLGTGREDITIDGGGEFTGQIEVPRISGSDGQIHQIEFLVAIPNGPVQFSEITNEVLRRMAETIFMALVATSLAIPISAALSFFAAHNLMRQIRVPIGNLMIAVIGLPLGWIFGSVLLGTLGKEAVKLGQGELNLGFLFMFGAITTARNVMVLRTATPFVRVRSIFNQLGFALMFVILLGLFGGFSLLVGEELSTLGDDFRPENNIGVGNWLATAGADGINAAGNFLNIIGGLIELFIVPIGGLVGAFTISSSISSLTTGVLRSISGVASHMLGAGLGVITGILVFAFVASIGQIAALLGLLTPFIAALFAKQIVDHAYQHFVTRRQMTFPKFVSRGLGLVAAVALFIITFDRLNVGRTVIDGTLPALDTLDIFGFEVSRYLFNAMLIGGVLGGIMGLLTGIREPFPVGSVLYNVTRNILNALRSIEPLIMGIVFVIWVGIGPFAGVLALMLHSIASLGKLYSEQIETIDEGPLEALKATGAGHLQTIIYAVVPQIVPPYVAFTMYRWDINVRMSTIIGFVGGGGIGLLLNQQINLLRYRDAGVAVLAIAIVVSILDYASASIREKII